MSGVINIKLTDMQTMAVVDACKAYAGKIVASSAMRISEFEQLGDIADALIAIECAVINADEGGE